MYGRDSTLRGGGCPDAPVGTAFGWRFRAKWRLRVSLGQSVRGGAPGGGEEHTLQADGKSWVGGVGGGGGGGRGVCPSRCVAAGEHGSACVRRAGHSRGGVWGGKEGAAGA